MGNVKKNKYIPRFLRRFVPSAKWKRNIIGWICRFLLAWVGLTVFFRFIPVPYSAYMIEQKIAHLLQGDFNYQIKKDWVNLDDISWQMQLAVIAAEDQKFPQHWGLDFDAIQSALKHNETGDNIRGGSTISQQTAKNLYLWHGQSWIRKAIEVPTTLMLETLWSKRRILEVYLNIAEFAEGIFGVEAASQHFFKKSAKNLTDEEAALLAAVLPNPISFKADAPGVMTKRKQRWILFQMNLLGQQYLERL